MESLKIGGRQTILDLFAAGVIDTPAQTFLRTAAAEFTYAEIDQGAERFAQLLAEFGIGHGGRVALAVTNRPAFIVAFLGILRRGGVAVPLNTQYKPDECRYALEHAQCQAVVTEEALRATVDEACRSLDHPPALLVAAADSETCFTVEKAVQARIPTPARRPCAADLAGIFYTSGTTARPKGVMISHENMMYSAEVTIRSLSLSKDDVPALAFPLFHVNSLFYGVLTTIALGGSLGLLRGFSVSNYWKDVSAVHATWTPAITGPMIRLFLKQPPSDLDRSHGLRLAVGGTFLSLDELDVFTHRFGVKLLPAWSMTETVALGTVHPNQRRLAFPSTTAIGYPTLGSEIRLVDAEGVDVAPGQPGEIFFRSPSLFQGYLNDEQATRSAFTEQGWFRTGDVAQMDASGYLTFVDRKRDMIKSKGENVAAAEVERVLAQYPGVIESAVVGVPDKEGLWGERIEAFVVRSAQAEFSEEELIAWVQKHLADFKVPKAIHFVEALPKNSLGKIQRQALKAARLASLKSGS
jgi:crotonobetaine/carnitine-CoA ligase